MTRPSAGRVRAMVRKEARQLLRDPRTRLVVFVAPVIQLLLFGYAVTTDLRDAATWVVDLDRSADSRRLSRKDRQIDRIRHLLVSGVVRVQVVARIVRGKEAARLRRIARSEVEVDHRVERAGRADPLV
mgnify:CR=1 FL=1